MVRRNVQWRLLFLLDADDHLFQGPVVRNSFYSENLLYACTYTDPEPHGDTEPYGNTYPFYSNADTDPLETNSYADSDAKCNAHSYTDGVSYGHTNARSDTYSDSNSYTDGLANSNTYGYADGNTDRNADTDTDRHAYT